MPRSMSTFHCAFLGCKVNQYDAERARRYLMDQGFQETDAKADVLLLASCTVTATAASKGRQSIRAMLRRHPDAEVAVMGCLTEEDRRFYASLEAPVTILPSAREDRFLEDLAPAARRARRFPNAPAPTHRGTVRTRFFLKVEDGCDLACSYCVIPSVRGKARSRTADDIEAEVRHEVDRGVPEIVLTGVHLGHYGRRGSESLPQLLRRLDKVPGNWRMRLSSLEASELSPEMIDVITGSGRIVPHLHLPLQSGSEAVLRAMRRPYTAALFRRKVREIRQRWDRPAITTDVILGFPGERDQDFQDTLDLCQEAGFSKIHQFPYSPRQGTVAAELPGRLHGSVMKERKRQLLAVETALRRESLQQHRNDHVRVAVESIRPDGSRVGYDERYHRVRLEHSNVPVGSLLEVEVTGVEEDELIAREPALAVTP